MTIDQKLSTIKAINEEKDLCDKYLQDLSSLVQFETVSFSGTHFIIPNDLGYSIVNVLKGYFATRRMELVSKALAIMKSEDPQPAT